VRVAGEHAAAASAQSTIVFLTVSISPRNPWMSHTEGTEETEEFSAPSVSSV
jgi:hypothetical protein